MAVLALFSGKITKAQYEAVRKELSWENSHPAGALCHVAAFDEQGNLHVADVWESEQAFHGFLVEKLAPVFGRMGLQPPTTSVLPIHNLNAYSGIDRFQV